MMYSISIGQEDYTPFERLEGLTGKQCYDKFGLKRSEHIDIDLVLDNRYTLYLSTYIPVDEDIVTYTVGTLYDSETNKYYDTDDCGDSIMGEWYFEDDEYNEISVELGLH